MRNRGGYPLCSRAREGQPEMLILEMKPATNRGGGAMAHVATFDLHLADEIRFYGMRLLRTPVGEHVSYAPTAIGGRRSATFARPLAEKITAAALASYTEHVTANARTEFSK